MSFPRYPKYKASGVEWLGDVPEHWATPPLWTMFRREKRVGFPDETLLSVYRDFGVLSKASRDDNFNKPSDDLGLYQLVEPGDLVVNKMKAWQGSVGISGLRGIVSPAYFVYRGRHTQDFRYLHHLLRCLEYTAGYLSLSKGIRINQWDLDPDYHSRMPVLIPPLSEQINIASFLDRETAKIDALVAEQERLIALLKEKRQAVISHAVTKGLDPGAPMKESGVKWLGAVPAHWTVAKLSRHLTILSGYAFPSDGFSHDDADTRLLRGINVGVGEIRWSENVYWQRQPDDGLDKFALIPGDIVVGMDRPWISGGLRIAKLGEEDVPSLLLQRVAALRGDNSLTSDFLLMRLQANEFADFLTPDMTGVSVPHISPEQIGAFTVAFPPRDEQKKISDFLATELEKLDSLTSEATAGIALFQERRDALISAAVTGKIDVRGLVAAEAEAA